MEYQWGVSRDTTGNAPRLGDGQVADQRVAPRTNAPRKTTGTEAGGRGHGAGTAAGLGPETESEPDAPGAETGGGPEAEKGGGRVAGAGPGGPDLAAPARAGEQMKSQGARRKTFLILYPRRKRLKRRKKMRRLRIKTLTRTSWRRR